MEGNWEEERWGGGKDGKGRAGGELGWEGREG